MTTNNEFATALAAGGYDADLLRAGLVGRVIYPLADAEDPANLVAVVDGRVPLAIAWHSIIFWLDPDDTTSTQDGTTVIKTSDNYVYKVEDPDYRIRSVLSDTTEDPPESPAVGDAYLVPAGATGVWSSHQDDIAIFTRNGWRFEVPGIGKWLLIEDVDGFKRYSATGWLYGPGARSFDDDSVPLSAALGFGERIIVESQTTTTPPTATKGLRYIVGEDAEDDWLGKDGRIAICEVAGTWTFYSPSNGWEAYDKSTNTPLRYNGTAWESANGAVVFHDYKETDAAGGFDATSGGGFGGFTHGGSGFYTYSVGTAPTKTNSYFQDSSVLVRAAKRSGAKLRFKYEGDLGYTAGSVTTVALFRDSETTAMKWRTAAGSAALSFADFQIRSEFIITSADTSSHTYRVVFFVGSGTRVAISKRLFQIEEFA